MNMDCPVMEFDEFFDKHCLNLLCQILYIYATPELDNVFLLALDL